MCVMMGAICSAVSLRTLAGSSSGPCSSLILVEIFQLFNYSVCANIKRGHAGVQWMIYYRNGISFAGEYRGKLVVEGICLIAVVCDWFVIYSQGGNANVFSFVCLDE